MNKYILTLIFLITFSSCTITRQYYAFDHHGTESVKTNSDFKYVARNVMGKSKTTIKLSAWKRRNQTMVTDGLLADAKSELPDLGNNQAYANLTIDVLNTTKGTPSSNGTVLVEEITLEAVVSADIIEYYK